MLLSYNSATNRHITRCKSSKQKKTCSNVTTALAVLRSKQQCEGSTAGLGVGKMKMRLRCGGAEMKNGRACGTEGERFHCPLQLDVGADPGRGVL